MARYAPVQLAFKATEPEEGSSDKPPVIFAHGVGGTHEYFKDLPQIVANATKRKCYAIDARNHGDSPWSDVSDFDCNVDDLLHLMDTLKVQKASIVGSSMGGITGMKAALRVPERVDKLVVEDMHVQKIPQEVFVMVPMLMALARNTLLQIPKDVDETTAKEMLTDIFIKNLPEEMRNFVKPEVLAQNIPFQLKRAEDGSYTYKSNYIAIENFVKEAMERDLVYEGVFDGPALFIYGKLSPFQVGAAEANIKKHFPKAELKGIDNATHAVYLDCPKEYAEAVVEFLLKE